ncbi:ABC transporter permease subunit [Kiloniella laminariae]|uniref:ABC transporter permease subunit n=1 Tax=Kiloniella laminariae TaxID=454162 RepID=A0ABT4LGI6_9PROT|nr:ABC transporter permease subunit [Kiloniella laminariae]MCZ4280209.1 ABC transporter permease subunit [Kiloniella laminariae]
MRESRFVSMTLVAPALFLVAGLFLWPLGKSLIGAFVIEPDGEVASRIGIDNFIKAFSLYGQDVLYTVGIVTVATLLVGLISVGIGGYITLCGRPVMVAALKWLYRWPLFIPFVVVGQMMRTFLAKNGFMNNSFEAIGLIDGLTASGYLDWRGIIIAFVWKQTAFAALLVSGAMAALDRSTIEAGRDLGASPWRILGEIIVPQIKTTLMVSLILSFVTMLSVLSVPMMIGTGTPTMMTVDMAWRINGYSDYGVANALGFISMAMAGTVAWIYLKQAVKEGGQN